MCCYNPTPINLKNLSNKMYKIQDMLFDFQEDVTENAERINTTIKVFMETVRQRLSPRDVLPACLYHAFFYSALTYLADKPNGHRLLIQKMPAISEERRSDMLESVSNIDSLNGRYNQSLYLALANLPENNKNTPMRGLLFQLSKCMFEKNTAQIIIRQFKCASSSQTCKYIRGDVKYVDKCYIQCG